MFFFGLFAPPLFTPEHRSDIENPMPLLSNKPNSKELKETCFLIGYMLEMQMQVFLVLTPTAL